jgi:hypothetical protein
MAGTSPAMTQGIEFKVDRHARTCSGHPRGAVEADCGYRIRSFFRILLVEKGLM